VRDTSPVDADTEHGAPDIEIHRAGIEDIEVVLKLSDDLARHHNASPNFLPYLPETAAAQRAYQIELLEDPANPHFIAYRGGEPVGMQTFHAPDIQDLARPEKSVYLFTGITVPGGRGGGVGTALLRHAMDWARGQGYERCALHYFTANLSGARFWTRSGFRPLTERMVRRVDERIAWATGKE
jgi:GNAT superfamily N-acetyltransferase